MIGWLQRNPVFLALAALAALLVVALAVELAVGGPGLPEGTGRKGAAAEAKLLPPVVALAPEQAYPESVTRPLFTPTRRPAPAATQSAAAVFQPGQYTLLGVTIAGDTKIAMVREKASGRIHRVEKGKPLNGIQVADILPESITLAQGDARETLSLQVQKPGGGSASAPPLNVPGAPVSAAGPFGAQQAAQAHAPAVPPEVAAAQAANPINRPVGGPGGAFSTFGQPAAQPGGANPNPGAGTVPQATGAPMTPEELLARRRARRAQQNQQTQ